MLNLDLILTYYKSSFSYPNLTLRAHCILTCFPVSFKSWHMAQLWLNEMERGLKSLSLRSFYLSGIISPWHLRSCQSAATNGE